jgi:hypothetical protein
MWFSRDYFVLPSKFSVDLAWSEANYFRDIVLYGGGL